MSAGDELQGGHAAYDELAVGFALDALEPDDEARFLDHLGGCRRCDEALADHRAIAAELAYAVDPVEPVPMPPALAALVASAPGGLPADPFPATGPGRLDLVTARGALRLRRAATLRRRVLVAAAALVVLAIGGTAVYDVVARPGPGSGQVAAQEPEAGALAAVNDPAATVGRLAALRGGAGSGTAVVSGGHAWLVVSGLPVNDPRTTRYVVWQVTGLDGMTARAAFDVRHEGATPVDLGPADKAATGNPRYAVTLEKGIGPRLPTKPGAQRVLLPAPVASDSATSTASAPPEGTG